jgi:hypothetical protein
MGDAGCDDHVFVIVFEKIVVIVNVVIENVVLHDSPTLGIAPGDKWI